MQKLEWNPSWASCKGVFRISSTSLSHVVQSVLPLAAMAFFRTARQTSHGIRHLSLKVKLSHSLGKLVSATFSVVNLGPLRSYKARSLFSNRLLRRGTDLLPSMRDQRPGQKNSPRALTSGVSHARSIETSMRRLTSNDRNGAISYWIFTNKISSFRKLQDLSNGIFAFKIGLKMTSNEVRKTT